MRFLMHLFPREVRQPRPDNLRLTLLKEIAAYSKRNATLKAELMDNIIIEVRRTDRK